MSKSDYVVNKKKKPFFSLIKIILAIVVLAIMIGLENSVEINNLSFGNIIGLDKSPNENDNLLVTFQFINPKMESSNSISTENTFVTSVEAKSIDLAVSSLAQYLSSNLSFSTANAIIISEDLAKDGVQRYISTISSSIKYNSNMYVLVCEGKAQDFIETLDKNKDIKPLSCFKILEISEKNNGGTDVINLTEFNDMLHTNNAVAHAPICKLNTDNKDEKESNSSDKEKNEDSESSEKSSSSEEEKVDNTTNTQDDVIKQKSNIKLELGGTAIFKDDKLIGKISTDETAYHVMLASILESYNTTIDLNSDTKTNNQSTSIDINILQTKKAKINVDTNGIRPRIDIQIPLNVIVLSTPAGEYNYSNIEYINNLKERIKDTLDKKMKDYIYKLQNEYDSDLDALYKYSRKNFLTLKKYNEYNFKEKFKDAKINVKFDISFKDSGLNLQK